MAERGQRLQPTPLAPLRRERRNCGWNLENLPSERFTTRNRLTPRGFLNSRRWVFVEEDDFRKDRSPQRGPKEAFLPLIHHGAPDAAPKKRQSRLPRGPTLLPKLSREAFLEEGVADSALHSPALYPLLKEALPAELLLQVLEVLDPEKKLEDLWAYCQDTRKPTKEPTKLVEKHSSQVCLPKKMLVSRSGQWLCEEKPSKADSIYKNSLLYDGIRREVRDFCHWAADLGSAAIQEELVLQQFDMDYHTRRSCDVLPRPRLNQDKLVINGPPSLQGHCGRRRAPRSPGRGRANPQKPKRVKMRYRAWYLNTSLWKRQRVDEPLVDPKVSHEAQDSNFQKQLQEQEELLAGLRGTAAFKDFLLSRGYRMPRFLEKIHVEEKGKSENIKTPKDLTQTERNPGRR